MKLLTTKQVVIRIAIIISVVELLVMLALGNIAYKGNAFTEAVIDTVFLVVLSTPAVYFWVIKPFVDAREDALAKIQLLALTDPLTQLANRRLISRYLVKVIAACVRHKDYGAVMLIDLDEFKPVNDTLGHEAGDAVLVEIASRLQSAMRAEDVVGRLGGDEFVVLIHHLGNDKHIASNMSFQVAQKLIKEINKPVKFNSNIIQVGASVGIRLLDFNGTGYTADTGVSNETDSIMKEVDIAMYRAKSAGRGCSIIFE